MTEEIYSLILKDSNLQAKLVLATGKSCSTIARWARNKDERLTSLKITTMINEHLFGKSDHFLKEFKKQNR